jgi:hypothetical protein
MGQVGGRGVDEDKEDIDVLDVDVVVDVVIDVGEDVEKNEPSDDKGPSVPFTLENC